MEEAAKSLGWKEVVATMSFRNEIVTLAKRADANIGEIARRFKVSRKTIYKWLGRYAENGEEGLRDRSRRPHRSPQRSDEKTEAGVLKIRDSHPAWGARKIRARLMALGQVEIPAESTIHEILRRKERIDPKESIKHTAWQRFGVQFHALTILDEHSRYVVCMEA